MNSPHKKLTLVPYLLLSLIIGASACVKSTQHENTAFESTGGMITHEVKYPGETLGVIASWYTGKASNWKQIAEANPSLNPSKIRLGDEIMIPLEIVQNDQSLPQEFIQNKSFRKKRGAAAKAEAETDRERLLDELMSGKDL